MVHTRSSSRVLHPLKPMKRKDYLDQFKKKQFKKKPELPPIGTVDTYTSLLSYYFRIRVKNPDLFDCNIECNGSVNVQGVDEGMTASFELPGPVDPKKLSYTFLDGIFECVVKKSSE